MQDLSLHVLDLAQNSLKAGARHIKIKIEENPETNWLTLELEDDGKGMEEAFTKVAMNPFITTRTTRKVGLGLALLERNCELAGGKLLLQSQLNKGTYLKATFKYDHIDRVPIGKMSETLVTLILEAPQVEYDYEHLYQGRQFIFNTASIQQELGELPINDLQVVKWLKRYLVDEISKLKII